MEMSSGNRHFVLVHGAGGGGWSWYKVTDLLLKAGHTVSALDMASAGIDSREADHIQTLQDYNQPLTGFFAALPSQEKDKTLVGSLQKKCPLWEGAISYSSEKYGSIPRAYVMAKEDKFIVEEMQRETITNNPPQMVYKIEGYDDCPFFSKPESLTQILIQIANTCAPM